MKLDLTFGMSPEARAVLALLSETHFPDILGVVMTTRPFYNGRECGFMVSASALCHPESIRIFVANHRNSSRILVETITYNQPADEELTHAEYIRVFEEEKNRTQKALVDTVEEAVQLVDSDLRQYLALLQPKKRLRKSA